MATLEFGPPRGPGRPWGYMTHLPLALGGPEARRGRPELPADVGVVRGGVRARDDDAGVVVDCQVEEHWADSPGGGWEACDVTCGQGHSVRNRAKTVEACNGGSSDTLWKVLW